MQDRGDPRLLEAIEASWFEYLKWRANLLNGDVYDTPSVKRIYSGYPLDGVFLARLSRETVEATITEMIAYFMDRQHAFRWYIGPTTTPRQLATYLLSHGFLKGVPRRGMAINLNTVTRNISTPNRLRIVPVSDVEVMRDWLHVELSNAGIPELMDHLQTMLQSAETIGFDNNLPLQRYVGYLQDTPVATSQLFLTEHVARIDAVSVLHDVRGRGIGTAMSITALRAASLNGYHVAVLWGSPMGAPLYSRIGFTDYGEIDIYRYSCTE